MNLKELSDVLVSAKKPPTTAPPKARQPQAIRPGRHGHHKKSGVSAPDRYVSDTAINGAIEAEREEDDDYDFVEAANGEDRNGTKGTHLIVLLQQYRSQKPRRKA